MSSSDPVEPVNLPIHGSCHCGAVSFDMSLAPQAAVKCNCSICRRLGAVWGHGDGTSITISAATDATVRYSHGDRDLAFHTCRSCGVPTHWEGISTKTAGKLAVNLNLAAPGTILRLGLRHFDGADSWTFFD